MENMNYFLVETNRLKVNNYAFISSDLVLKLLDFVYNGYDGKVKRKLESIYRTKFSIESNYYLHGVELGKLNLGVFGISCIKDNLNGKVKCISSNTSTLIKGIYTRGKVFKEYREFAFILFLLGMVDIEDYLKYAIDLTYFGSKFCVTGLKNEEYRVRPKDKICIPARYYIKLIGYYFKNSLNDINYGCSPLDFISVILKYDYLDKCSRYDYIIGALREVGIDYDMCSSVEVSSDIVNKYPNEMGILVALMGKRLSKKGTLYILSRCDAYLQDAVLNSAEYIRSIGMPGVYYQ